MLGVETDNASMQSSAIRPFEIRDHKNKISTKYV